MLSEVSLHTVFVRGSFSTVLWIKCWWDSAERFLIVFRSQGQTIILWSECWGWARRSVRCWRASPVQSQTLLLPTWTPPCWAASMRLGTCSFGSSLATAAKYSILCRLNRNYDEDISRFRPLMNFISIHISQTFYLCLYIKKSGSKYIVVKC